MDKKGKRKLVHAMTIRIALPALLTILLFVTAIFLIILPSLKENLLAKKRELLQEVLRGGDPSQQQKAKDMLARI